MHRIPIFLLLSSLALLPARSTEKRIWILFKDRNLASSSSHQFHPDVYFSEKSRLRRLYRAENIWDQTDLAISKDYVQKIKEAGAVVYRESRWLNGVSAYCNNSCRSKIGALPFVSEVLPVITYRRPRDRFSISRNPKTGVFDRQKILLYGQSADQLKQIDVPPIHRKGFAGQGEVVAIFDSGFRKDHVAFKNHKIIAEKDFVFNDGNVSDGMETDLHGTATWSCVGGEAPGNLYGPAYKADVLLAITEDIRTETQVEEDNWVAGLEWADQNGATVISSSLGYPDFYLPSQLNGRKAISSRAASTAARKGIVVVNSAGNEGPGKSTIGPPADARRILAVGAIDSKGRIAFFSSRGPTSDGRIKPEVVARGVETFVATSITPDSFDFMDGTSFSCPLVAGSAAVLLSAHPRWKPNQVRLAFLKTANMATHPDNNYGWGLIDLAAAYDYLPKRAIVIEHTAPASVRKSQTFIVEGRIRAQRGLDLNSIFLFWKTGHDAQFQKIPLLPVAGKADFFAASISGQPGGTELQYYLSAADVKGKNETLPPDAPQNTFQVKIR